MRESGKRGTCGFDSGQVHQGSPGERSRCWSAHAWRTVSSRGGRGRPSGGVKAENMADYLAVPGCPRVSGSWMVDAALLRAGAWDEVSARSAHAVVLATAPRPDR